MQDLIDNYSLPENLFFKLKDIIGEDDMGLYDNLRLDTSKNMNSKLDNTSMLLDKYDPSGAANNLSDDSKGADLSPRNELERSHHLHKGKVPGLDLSKASDI